MKRQPTNDEIVAEIGDLIKSGERKTVYLTAAKRIQGFLKHLADQVCNGVDGTKADASLVIRAIARKTEEDLASVIYCVEGNHCYAATGLLRPICEELIFAKFLRSIARTDADEFVRMRSLLDVHEGIKAQEDFFADQQRVYRWADNSVPGSVVKPPADLEQRIAELKAKMKDLGKRIGWGNTPKPSVRYMADSSDATAVYNYFYHAASSSVHASLHHLLRMV